MSLISSLGNILKKILSKILKFLKKILGKYWMILLALAVIWFAPAITAFLTSVGAPSFVVGIFETLSLATPYLTSAVTWLWQGGSAILSGAWNAFASAGIGTQAAILLGAASLLAPEETQQFLTDAVDFAGDVVASVGGALADAVSTSPLLWAGLGLFGIWLLMRRDPEKEAYERAAQEERVKVNEEKARADVRAKIVMEGGSNGS